MPESEQRVAPWEDLVLRLIALYKIIKAAICFAFGFGLRQLLHTDVGQFVNDYVIENHIDPENRLLHKLYLWIIAHASQLTDHSIRLISYLVFFYGAIFLVEGVGLYLRKHWAEYMVLLSTGLLLPIEFYEIHRKLALWKFGVIFGNLLIIVYLVHRLMLDHKFKEEQKHLAAEKAASEASATTSKTALRGDSVVNEVQ